MTYDTARPSFGNIMEEEKKEKKIEMLGEWNVTFMLDSGERS